MSNWYAVRTATRREGTAHDGLAERKFTAFLPMSTHLRRSNWTGDKKVDRPLFPGYLFVLCTPDDFPDILKIEACHQFVRYVKDDELTPMPFPLNAIIGVQAAECRGDFDYTRTARVEFRPKKGVRVQVTAGTWQGYIGKVLDTPAKQRALVMMEGPFGRGVSLDVAHLTAA